MVHAIAKYAVHCSCMTRRIAWGSISTDLGVDLAIEPLHRVEARLQLGVLEAALGKQLEHGRQEERVPETSGSRPLVLMKLKPVTHGAAD